MMETATHDQSRPVASFVCITYNHVHLIRRCLDAFLAQDVDFPVEFIIHDDASTDGTAEVLTQYAAKEPERYRLILQEHNSRLRQSNALCDAVETARGDYILLCEGDDYWTDPHKARRQIQFLSDHPDYSFAFHDAVRVEAGNATPVNMVPHEWRRDWTPGEIRSSGFLFFPLGTLCFRRSTQPWPPELVSTPNFDIFLARVLAESGSGHWMGDEVGPLHSTVHPAGMWSGATNNEREQMLARTYLNITSWLIRMGHVQDARAFAEATLLPHLTTSLHYSQPSPLGRMLQVLARGRL